MDKKYISPRRKQSSFRTGKTSVSKSKSTAGPVKTFFVKRWSWFKSLNRKQQVALIGAPIAAFLIIVPVATYAYFANTISDPNQLLNYNNTGVVLEDRDGEVFYSFGTADRGERLSLDQISDYTEKALISAEDKNFYEHSGFSLVSIAGAMLANVSSGDFTAYGGSTLTQQLAKNTVLYNDRTVLRKYQELAIAVAIERQYSKGEILDLYLNSVYYGEGAFGIESAAETYFNKSAADLSLAESAMLIGVLPAPSAYSPISGNMEYAKERQATVLDRMVDNGVISEAEAEAAKAQELAYADGDDAAKGKAPHFAEMIMGELYEKYGEEQVTRSGYRVKTTLDMDLQQVANDAVASHRPVLEANGGSNASVVAIDPKTGYVTAFVGSVDYQNKDFGTVNMVTTPRQPGSSVKPLYYAEALHTGVITPSTVIADQPTDFGGYRPLNADRQFRGDISVRNAISQSLNIPSVEVMKRLGVDESVDALRRLGLTTVEKDKDYGLSLALGSAEASLIDMTHAYSALANKGLQADTVTILAITNKYDKKVFEHKADDSKRVMGEEASFMISDILNDESARAPVFGSTLNTPGFDVAVKTGTTDEARDAWTIGYSPTIAVGVWVGNNDNEPMLNGGSVMAGPIWRATISKALSMKAAEKFVAPDGVVRLLVCRSNGLRAVGGGTDGTYQEYFKRDAIPEGTCDVPKPPEDSDKDGVTNDKDKCPDTKPGVEVDSDGCEVKDEPIDTDGDGVSDDKDRCPGTTDGAEVDNRGCEVADEPDETNASETTDPPAPIEDDTSVVRPGRGRA